MCGKLRYIQNMEFLTGSSTKSSKFDEYLSCWSPFSCWHCVVFVAILHGSDRVVFGWSDITGDAVPVKPFGKSSGKFLAMKSGIGLTICTFWCFFNTWNITIRNDSIDFQVKLPSTWYSHLFLQEDTWLLYHWKNLGKNYTGLKNLDFAIIG